VSLYKLSKRGRERKEKEREREKEGERDFGTTFFKYLKFYS